MCVSNRLFAFQNSIVVAFLGHSHRSRQWWAKPEEFYPEHFLDENGQLRVNVEGFLPFSLGINLQTATGFNSFTRLDNDCYRETAMYRR